MDPGGASERTGMRGSSGGVEALVRALAGHAQHIPDRLPRQAGIARGHHGPVERVLGGAKAHLRDHDPREDGIIDRGRGIRADPAVGALDLVEHLLGGPHIPASSSRTSRARTRHGRRSHHH